MLVDYVVSKRVHKKTLPMSEDYYNQNADSYFEATAHLDMGDFYEHFLEFIPQGGHILDLGCGSGRDTLAFLNRGYRVTALDASEEMVKRAKEFTGSDILHLDFSQISFEITFDSVFACATLLHVPREELPEMLIKIHSALQDHGVLYMSFKNGEFNGKRNGRHFTDMNRESLTELLEGSPFEELDYWETSDLRPTRANEKWVNAIVRKES